MTAACSGGAGDIVYSIPVMRALGVNNYAIKVNHYEIPDMNLFKSVQSLLISQGFECIATSGATVWGEFEPGLKYDINIDSFRNQRVRGSKHIIQSMAAEFGVELPDWSNPWLSDIKPVKSFDNLIHLTKRWRERSHIKWSHVLTQIINRKKSIAFIGLPSEYESFCIESGLEIPYLETDNLLQFAELIQGCDALYCNQSVGLAIAQGLDKKYFLECKPNKQNCLMYTKNENILK